MLNSVVFAVFLMVAVTCSTCYTVKSHYEECLTYSHNPWCKPSKLNIGVKCSAIGSSIEIKGGLVSISFVFLSDEPNYDQVTSTSDVIVSQLSDYFLMLVIFYFKVFQLGTSLCTFGLGILCSTTC